MRTTTGIASVIGLIVLMLLPSGTTPIPAPLGDVLGQCHVADRASQVRILRQASTMPVATVEDKQAAVKFVNDQRIASRTADWIPFTDEVGKAIDGGTLSQLADTLEAAK